MPQVLRQSVTQDNQDARGGSKGEIQAFLQQWLVKIVELSPVGILEPLGINHGPKRSSSKGQDYIDHIRAISQLSIELRAKRDEASDPDSKLRDDIRIRALLAARSKAVNRSKNGSKPWFPDVAKTIEKCLVPPDSLHGARKNTFTKYMNFAIVAGVREDLPEVLRCTPPSEYMEFARKCLEKGHKSRDQIGARGLGNGQTADSTEVGNPDSSEVSKSQKSSETSSGCQAHARSTVSNGDSQILQTSSSFTRQGSDQPPDRPPAGRDGQHGLCSVPGNQPAVCLQSLVPACISTNSCKDLKADSMAEADAIEALAKMQSGWGEQATRYSARSGGVSQLSSTAVHGTAMVQYWASTGGDCIPRSGEQLAKCTRSTGFSPFTRHGQSRAGMLQAMLQHFGAEPGKNLHGSDGNVERKADIAGATAATRLAGVVQADVKRGSLQRPDGQSTSGQDSSKRLSEQLWLGPRSSEALPSVQVVMDDNNSDEEDEEEGTGRVGRRLDSQNTVADHAQHMKTIDSEVTKDGAVVGEREALAPKRPRFDHPLGRTLSVGLGPCHEIKRVASSPMPQHGLSSSSRQHSLMSCACSTDLSPEASKQTAVAVTMAPRPADLMRQYPPVSSLVATDQTSLASHTRSSGHHWLGIATGRGSSTETPRSAGLASSSLGDFDRMQAGSPRKNKPATATGIQERHRGSVGPSVVRVDGLERRVGAHAGAGLGMKRSRSTMNSYAKTYEQPQPYSSVSMMGKEGGTSRARGAAGRFRPPCAAAALESSIGMPPIKVRKVSAN